MCGAASCSQTYGNSPPPLVHKVQPVTSSQLRVSTAVSAPPSDDVATSSPELCCGLLKEDSLPRRWAKKKGTQNSSVFLIDQTNPSPVALLAPSWTRRKPFAPAVCFASAPASASPNHLRISFNLPWNCSHIPDHCHPHYQAQAFTKHYQPSWRPQ